MSEAEFWDGLESRISREFAGMAENHLRYLWCDGFTPQHYLLDASPPSIRGRAWICNGPKQDEWAFTLFLDPSVDASDRINWQSLIPLENQTGWLAVDGRGKVIEIGPLAAVAEPKRMIPE